MSTTTWTHGIPRWLWHLGIGVLLLGVLATTAVTGPAPDRPPLSTDPVPSDEPTAEPNIVGGRAAQPGEYPFAVSLLRHGIASRYDAAFCGGSLIGPDLVLTAAHCVHGDPPDRIDVLVNTHDLLRGGQRLPAEAVHVHPSYDPYTTANDVAVVELARFVEPARLVTVAGPNLDLQADPGTMATVIGWGSTKTAGYPTALRTTEVPIVSDESCRASYGRAVIESVMVCAGLASGGRDSCSGDSGGPLMVRDDEADWIQVGVVSWGYGCALPGLPGVYAEVAALHDFLDPYTTGFRDVPAWVAPSVDWIVDAGHAEGFADRRFRPTTALTRAQAVEMLHRIVDPPAAAVAGVAQPFSDVPAWIDDAVRWVANDPDGPGPAPALMSGYGDGTFRPDQPVSRAEITRLLWRLAGEPEAPRHALSDVGGWVGPAVAWITAEGHATGWPDGTFRPAAELTRAQATRMLHRIYG